MSVVNGDVLKAVANFVLQDGTIMQNVFHFIAEFAGTQTDSGCVAAIKSYTEDIYTPILSYINSGVTAGVLTVDAVSWDPGTAQWQVSANKGEDTLSLTFTSGADSLPNQMSAVLIGNTWRPKSRGRKFLIPFAETAAVVGDLISAVLTALATSLSHFLADETVAGADLLSPGIVRAAADTFLPFSNGQVNSILGTQRRRKPGVGQ